MSAKYNAGKFKIEVSDPHPAWVQIWFGGYDEQFPLQPTMHGIKISELKDLHYIIGRALEDAKGKDLG